MANSLWQAEHDPINPHYVEDVRQVYKGEYLAINFNSPGAAETINEWVAERRCKRSSSL